MGNKKHQIGFTLVELIIALVILSFVMVLCGSGFRFGSRVWDSVNTQSERVDVLQAAQGFLRKNISHALIHDRLFTEEEALNENLFIGDGNRIRFISYSPQYGVDDFLYAYELYLDKNTNQLSLRYSPYNLGEKISRNKSISSIVDGVKDVDIQYFSGFVDENDGDGWFASWNDVYSLPLLIKINVTFFNEQMTWPEMIIQMRNGPYVVR